VSWQWPKSKSGTKIQLPDGRTGWIHSTAVQQGPPAQTPPVLAPTLAPPAAAALSLSAPPPVFTPSRPSETVTAPPMSRRTALVIGNAAYPATPLRNAGKDATAISATLRRLGFDVTLLREVPLPEMDEAVHVFNGRLRQGGMGLFYFAGHGVQVDGENYLIPLNTRIAVSRTCAIKRCPWVGSWRPCRRRAMGCISSFLTPVAIRRSRGVGAPVRWSWRSRPRHAGC
jgi:Caspase domain